MAATTPALPADGGMALLAGAIAEAINSTKEKPRIRFGQHSLKTPFNPEGKKNRGMRRVHYQNGHLMQERVLTDREIALLDKIKQGSYLENKIQVLEVKEGIDNVVHIRYNNRNADARNDLDALAPTLAAKLQMIVDEGVQQAAAIKAARRQEILEAQTDPDFAS